MKVLLIDHDDSFTHILAHYLGEISGSLPEIVNHKTIKISEIEALAPSHIVLSPGPGSVENQADFQMGHQVLERFAGEIPILGVCLGHQGIAHFYGAKIQHAPKVMHGKPSNITHNGKGLFAGIPSPLKVMRYHSLMVKDLPGTLEISAQSPDGVIMALQHKKLPVYGIQFHPESVGSDFGKVLLQNFLN